MRLDFSIGTGLQKWMTSHISSEIIQLLKKLVQSLPDYVYIFGHSLDITDKDVIRDFINRDGVKTTIFYYDKQQQTQQMMKFS